MPAHSPPPQKIRNTPVYNRQQHAAKQRQQQVVRIPQVDEGHIRMPGLQHVEGALEILRDAFIGLRQPQLADGRFVDREPQQQADDKNDECNA